MSGGDVRVRTFARLWFATIFRRPLEPIDLVSGLLGAALSIAAHFLPRVATVMIDLWWQVPVWSAGLLVAVRIVVAPYNLWKAAELAHEKTTERLNSLIDKYAFALSLNSIDIDQINKTDDHSPTGIVISATWQLVLSLQNGIDSPLRFEVRKFVINDIEPDGYLSHGGVIPPRGISRFSSPSIDLPTELLGRASDFPAYFEIAYGSPSKLSRIMKRRVTVYRYIHPPTTHHAVVGEEIDEALTSL